MEGGNMEDIGLNKCDKCGHLMRWGVYGIGNSFTTHYICQQCGNVRYIEVTKNEQETDKEAFEKNR